MTIAKGEVALNALLVVASLLALFGEWIDTLGSGYSGQVATYAGGSILALAVLLASAIASLFAIAGLVIAAKGKDKVACGARVVTCNMVTAVASLSAVLIWCFAAILFITFFSYGFFSQIATFVLATSGACGFPRRCHCAANKDVKGQPSVSPEMLESGPSETQSAEDLEDIQLATGDVAVQPGTVAKKSRQEGLPKAQTVPEATSARQNSCQVTTT